MNRLIDELNYYAKIEANRIPPIILSNFRMEYFQDFSVEVAMDGLPWAAGSKRAFSAGRIPWSDCGSDSYEGTEHHFQCH